MEAYAGRFSERHPLLVGAAKFLWLYLLSNGSRQYRSHSCQPMLPFRSEQELINEQAGALLPQQHEISYQALIIRQAKARTLDETGEMFI